MKRLMNGFFLSGGLVLAASAVGILVGVEHLLQTQKPKRRMPVRVEPVPEPAVAVPEPVSVSIPTPVAEPPKADRHFSIKRTKSEIGYVYWILEGYGQYKCFVLCDSWDEAVAKAKARMAGDDQDESEHVDAAAESVLSVAAAAS